jgi:hypothetical protein
MFPNKELQFLPFVSYECENWSDTLTHAHSVAPEPEGTSPCSQKPANSLYPEPGESTPHPPPNQSP